ncbi:MAG: hypothetical protein ACK5V3_08865, partial [Bdellovibrionales bacterium]
STHQSLAFSLLTARVCNSLLPYISSPFLVYTSPIGPGSTFGGHVTEGVSCDKNSDLFFVNREHAYRKNVSGLWIEF